MGYFCVNEIRLQQHETKNRQSPCLPAAPFYSLQLTMDDKKVQHSILYKHCIHLRNGAGSSIFFVLLPVFSLNYSTQESFFFVSTLILDFTVQLEE